jgi:osmoprotectant transport system ATP-binding protein
MDEPFGAVDPVVRARLQQEFAAILRRLGKTVVLVTHDLDEAIRMADRLAIMKAGQIVQSGHPLDVLAKPADGFVADFLGADRGLKRLSLVTVAEVASRASPAPGAPEVDASDSLQIALSRMIAAGTETAAIRDSQGHIAGSLTLDAIRAAGVASIEPEKPSPKFIS